MRHSVTRLIDEEPITTVDPILHAEHSSTSAKRHAEVVKLTAPTLALEELPPWAHRYLYITAGYRNPYLYNSYASCFWSLFHWHTETLNVHLHLWAGLGVFGALGVILAYPGFAACTLTARVVTILGVLGCATMCFASAYAHATHSISARAERQAWRIDMMGIVAASYGRCLFDLWCLLGVHLASQPAFYSVAAATTAFGLYCSSKLWHHKYEWAYIFGAFCMAPWCVAMVAVAYAQAGELAARGVDVDAFQAIGVWTVVSSMCSFGGVGVFYIGRVPERFCVPGRTGRASLLNYFGNSHNFFHICTAASCYTGFMVVLYMAAFERSVFGASR